MAYNIPNALGYHGFELQKYDELAGLQNGWQNLLTPNLLDLLAIRYIILPAPQDIPGYHQVVAPQQTSFGTTATLYERDKLPAYARIVMSAVKSPEGIVVQRLVDPRFPLAGLALFPDTSTVFARPPQAQLFLSTRRATVSGWSPGRMHIDIAGSEGDPGHLIVSENWYPDWKATVDGQPGVVHRANHSLISVELPREAKEVILEFDSRTYALGKVLSLVSLIIAIAMIVGPIIYDRRARQLTPASGT
jgi:hypothetical protein